MGNEVRLTAGEVCEVAGVSYDVLRSWVQANAIAANEGGGGPGKFMAFTTAEAVAATMAGRLRASGYPASMVVNAVRFVAELGDDGIREAIESGRKVVMPLFSQPGRAFLIEPLPAADRNQRQVIDYCLNLERISADVKAKVAEIAARPARNGNGRRRGLELNGSRR